MVPKDREDAVGRSQPGEYRPDSVDFLDTVPAVHIVTGADYHVGLQSVGCGYDCINKRWRDQWAQVYIREMCQGKTVKRRGQALDRNIVAVDPDNIPFNEYRITASQSCRSTGESKFYESSSIHS